MLADFASYADDDTEGTIKPQKALWDARQVLGPDDMLLSDVGAHKMWVARYYQCHEPNTCLIPNGFCSMGFALPGAIAASLLYPDRRDPGRLRRRRVPDERAGDGDRHAASAPIPWSWSGRTAATA